MSGEIRIRTSLQSLLCPNKSGRAALHEFVESASEDQIEHMKKLVTDPPFSLAEHYKAIKVLRDVLSEQGLL